VVPVRPTTNIIFGGRRFSGDCESDPSGDSSNSESYAALWHARSLGDLLKDAKISGSVFIH
jgi:hypothetical protein